MSATIASILLLSAPLLLEEPPPTIVAFSPHGAAGDAWVQVRNDTDEIVNLSEWAIRWGWTEWYMGGINADDVLLYPGACYVWEGLPIGPAPGPKCAIGISLYDWCADVLEEPPVQAFALGTGQVCGLSGLGGIPDAPWPAPGEAVYIVDGEVILSDDDGPLYCQAWRPIGGPMDEKSGD